MLSKKVLLLNTMRVEVNGVPASWAAVKACIEHTCISTAWRNVVRGAAFPLLSEEPTLANTAAPAPGARVLSVPFQTKAPRKLASLQHVSAVEPIEGADAVVAARILGWTCVMRTGTRVGDAVVYFEIDALLPTTPFFDALLKGSKTFVRCEGVGEGYRIKTRRIRGVLSQGLAIPLTSLLDELMRARKPLDPLSASASSEVPPRGVPLIEPVLGLDVTAALGVLKFEAFVGPIAGLPSGSFPPFCPKTDQERIQNCFSALRKRSLSIQAAESEAASEAASAAPSSGAAPAPELFEVTLKLDGTSCTAFHNAGDAGVCSRNLRLKSGAEGGVYAALGDPVADALRARGLNLAVQMEICGPKIGGNREGFVKPRAFVFDVYDIDAGAYWTAPRRRALCAELGLEHVPVLEDTALERFESVQAVLAYAERPSIHNPVAEGVVFKSLRDPSVSFKAVSNAYLLREK